MALSAEDQRVVAGMLEREFNVKKRQRAANAVFHKARMFRWGLEVLGALILAVVAAGVFLGVTGEGHWLYQWRTVGLVAAIGAFAGALLAQILLRSGPGRRLLSRRERRLRQKYSGDLYAGRLWMQFYYRGEEISAYIPQILYALEGEGRFDSVREALEFVKRHHHQNAPAQAHALRQFNAVAEKTNLMVLSSMNAEGQLSSRVMYFVKTSRPGVWYATTAPHAAKVPQLDAGNVAVVTLPTEDSETIRSNRVRIRRAGKALADIADLYQAQAPGYLAERTGDDEHLELVYELTLLSAKVDTLVSHDVVSLDPAPSDYYVS